MKIHPMADLFPMHTEEMLQDLAASIKAHGLRHPIILDKKGQIIDGRNRFTACKIAGVEPQFRTEEGDPIDYIQDEDATRRSITKSQLAMATAIRYPEAMSAKEAGSLKGKSGISKIPLGVSKDYLSKARTVLRELPTLKDQVLAGVSLIEAYQVVLDQRKAKQEREEKIKEQEALLKQQKQEAEQRLADLKNDGEKKVAKLKLMIEEIGPRVELIIPKENVTFTAPIAEKAMDNITVGPDPFPGVEEQGHNLSRLLGCERQLEKLVEEKPLEIGWNIKSYHAAMWSGAITISNLAMKLLEKHREALEQLNSTPNLRKVK